MIMAMILYCRLFFHLKNKVHITSYIALHIQAYSSQPYVTLLHAHHYKYSIYDKQPYTLHSHYTYLHKHTRGKCVSINLKYVCCKIVDGNCTFVFC